MYEPIEGVREFADGRASTIGGLEMPDPYTLRVHLTESRTTSGTGSRSRRPRRSRRVRPTLRHVSARPRAR